MENEFIGGIFFLYFSKLLCLNKDEIATEMCDFFVELLNIWPLYHTFIFLYQWRKWIKDDNLTFRSTRIDETIFHYDLEI